MPYILRFMSFKRVAITQLLFKLATSLAYGAFVFSFVSVWSFDFEAVVDTIKLFQTSELSYIELLAFNSFLTYGFAKVLVSHDAEFIASLFYAISATL